MSKKWIIILLSAVVLAYPIWSFISAFGTGEEENMIHYQQSVWICWVLLAIISVFYKWTESRNTCFYFTYIFLLIAFTGLGFLVQQVASETGDISHFEDEGTLGLFATLQNLLVSLFLTGFLHAAVWWFRRPKTHRT